jgi:hypothetical protein
MTNGETSASLARHDDARGAMRGTAEKRLSILIENLHLNVKSTFTRTVRNIKNIHNQPLAGRNISPI